MLMKSAEPRWGALLGASCTRALPVAGSFPYLIVGAEGQTPAAWPPAEGMAESERGTWGTDLLPLTTASVVEPGDGAAQGTQGGSVDQSGLWLGREEGRGAEGQGGSRLLTVFQTPSHSPQGHAVWTGRWRQRGGQLNEEQPGSPRGSLDPRPWSPDGSLVGTGRHHGPAWLRPSAQAWE